MGKKTIDAQSWAAGERVEFERTSAMGKEVESRKSKTGTRALISKLVWGGEIVRHLYVIWVKSRR